MEFNKEFESYDKKLMRGTDVVTAMNMTNNYNSKNAWNMNKNLGRGGWDEELKIEAKVILKNPITVKKDHIQNKVSTPQLQSLYINEYHLIDFPTATATTITMDTNPNGYMADSKEYIAIMLDDENNDAHDTDFALKEFKRRFFRCNGITYSNVTGLVDTITFIEVDVGAIPGY